MKHKFPRSQGRVAQSGFSLIEIMVAIGVAGILTYAITTMMMRSGKQAASVASKSDFNSFVNQLQGIFNNTGNCLAAFGGAGVTEVPDPAAPPPAPAYPIPVTVRVAGAEYKQDESFGPAGKKALKIQKLEFAGRTSATGARQYVVPLSLVADRQVGDEVAVGGNLLSHTFNLIVTLDDTNKIVACAGQYTDFWSSTGASGLDIVYTGGNVAIGGCDTTRPVEECVDPPQAKLDVGGAIQALSFLYRSDERLKENVREIPGALDRVTRLHGVLYDWKAGGPGSRDQLGFVAQEVEKVFPEAVRTGSGSGMKSVGYGSLLAPLVEAVKAQQEAIDRQQREISELKQAVQAREAR